MSSTWKLTVSFAGMTWRDLRELVSRANVANIPDEEPVEFALDAVFDHIGIVVDAPPITEEAPNA